MDNKLGDQPAFPDLTYNEVTGQANGHNKGMTLRHYYAGQAMIGILSSIGQAGDEFTVNGGFIHPESVAKAAINIADAMLIELSKQP